MKNKTYNTINSTRKSDQKIYINHNKNREGKISVKNIVPFGTIQRFVARNEHTDLRQGIRQYKNSKKSKITSNSKVTVFLFFHIQKNRQKQPIKPDRNYNQ